MIGFIPERWLLVDVASQRLLLLHGSALVATWPVSTAAAGIDARADSGGTPPGVHRIADKIGTGADPGQVFVSRVPTDEIWRGETDPRDLILGRILTLDGTQEGVNRGPGVDSHKRFIYLHGTNHEHDISQPCSHGCVRLRRDDVVTLFDRVEVDDRVVIV